MTLEKDDHTGRENLIGRKTQKELTLRKITLHGDIQTEKKRETYEARIVK